MYIEIPSILYEGCQNGTGVCGELITSMEQCVLVFELTEKTKSMPKKV